MADDDRAVMDRLAALEAEVKAEADARGARKAVAVAKLRDQRAAETAERDAVRAGQAGRVARASSAAKRIAPPPSRDAEDANAADDNGGLEDLAAPATRRAGRGARAAARGDDHIESLGSAIELAAKANRVKQELARAPRKGEKSWIKSGVASLALGPIGWLYAGSMREAVPAAAGWVALALLASKILPVFLMMPVLMVVLPLSAIAGVVYALQYNRSGSRQRLFDRDPDKPKQLRGG